MAVLGRLGQVLMYRYGGLRRRFGRRLWNRPTREGERSWDSRQR